MVRPVDGKLAANTLVPPRMKAIPWIQQRHAGRLEIIKIAGDNRHAMHQRGCRDECVMVSARVGCMKGGAAERHSRIDRQNSFPKFREDAAMHPAA